MSIPSAGPFLDESFMNFMQLTLHTDFGKHIAWLKRMGTGEPDLVVLNVNDVHGATPGFENCGLLDGLGVVYND